MLALDQKKILYIGVRTFNYEKEIKLALEKLGASVDFYDERPANNFLTKVFLRLNLKYLIRSKVHTYYSNILEDIGDKKYDYVFVIKLEAIDEEVLTSIKKNQRDAVFILYLWDSIKNYKGKENLLPFFDRAFTFDRTDSIEYEGLQFLPLFYIPLYENLKSRNTEAEHDLCFIGSAHSDRYQLVKDVEKKARKLNRSVYAFLYLDSKLLFWIRKLIDGRMRSAKSSDISFVSLGHNEILDIIGNSTAVLDIEHGGQVGLTMRTIEMIGCRKKLITTNQDIRNYDFYDENNISVIDRDDVRLDDKFFQTTYRDIDDKIYRKYSVQSWLKTIFLCS